MKEEERQLMLTTAWLFARHGQGPRARVLLEAVVEENPRDGVPRRLRANRLAPLAVRPDFAYFCGFAKIGVASWYPVLWDFNSRTAAVMILS